MQQLFKIATTLLFLGIFLIPKNFNAAFSAKNSCCSSSLTDKISGDTNSDENPCHSDDEEKDEKSCNDCQFCSSPGFYANFQRVNYGEEDFLKTFSSGKISIYLTPEFSNFTSKIWQPPKIA